ncbi:MAG: hypothetical protein NZT92_08930 [Abditibacteriales bacterium]|nr:hypothetical protein [Abditibacteriales bacterium]MDW8366106.1 hypothetical protein [Abditibacteriales bacterium]
MDKRAKIALEKRLIQERITTHINQYYPAVQGAPLKVSVIPYHASATEWERRYRCEVVVRDHQGRVKTLRIFAKRGPVREYANLKALWDMYERHNVAPIPLPRPLDNIRACAVCLMEWLDGERGSRFFKTHLVTPIYRLRRERVHAVVRQMAEWLAQFHIVTCSGKYYDVTEEVHKALELLNTIPDLLSEQREELTTRLKVLSENAHNIPQVLCGEFAPRNIMLTANGIVVFDWADLRETYFGYNMHTLFGALRGFARKMPLLYSLKTIDEVEDVFLTHYRMFSPFEWSEEVYRATAALYHVTSRARTSNQDQASQNRSPGLKGAERFLAQTLGGASEDVTGQGERKR